ncbi:GGDEF domain-containing protein [Lacticaseibacillus sharpeae]|uniref:Diguanylate cyclase phosphodiesterase domain-containing protein n=1 Tax=Lacticaseibacillus sharpeae JCM 1186 = DSM 20505 TaxID=1291052 RepID=A0A0R1ZML9_9LACO|nr:GGDEF domain-containing protein [Lacticaseibacillus sharpeae]KRM56304.1 diguanylate cyclase phosphodiesterase domain-containing protein [Lacticaseibacillus sharpeae JCM 1186 = DSM 20505]
MAEIGLRVTTFLTNFIVLLAFIYLYDWLQTTDKVERLDRIRQPLLIVVTIVFLLFFHTSSILSIKNMQNPVGYGWTFLNFQIVTVYYALLSTRTRSMLTWLIITVGIWFIWMPPFTGWIPLMVATLVLFWAIQRFARAFATHGLRFIVVGFLLATPFFITNYAGLGGIDVGWPWQIITMLLLLATMWEVNRRLTRHSEHEQELVHDATIDDLTQLANFRSFDADLHDAYDRYVDHNELYSLYTFDIDHFKRINDNYGHLAGNEVLKAVAQRLLEIKGNLEYDARVYRTGGEEFSLLLFDVVESMSRAKEISREIRREINKLDFTFDNDTIHITISLGQDRATIEDKNYLDIYNRADQYLYSSKNNGRDAITVRGVIFR